MVIDFQQHYTPPELLKSEGQGLSARLDENGNPNYLLNPLLSASSPEVVRSIRKSFNP